MRPIRDIPILGALVAGAELVATCVVVAAQEAAKAGPVEPTPDPLDPAPVDATAAALQQEREAHEQTKAALTDSEARRRDLEALLDRHHAGAETTLDPTVRAWCDDAAAAGVPEELAERARAFRDAALDRIAMLRAAIDRDQTGLAKALARIVHEAEGRFWIAEGRGSYAWDDDAYRREAGQGYEALASIGKQALRASGDLATRTIRNEPLGPEPVDLTVDEAVAVMLADEAQRAALVESRWTQMLEAARTAKGSIAWRYADAMADFLAAVDVAVVESLKAIQFLVAPTTRPLQEPLVEVRGASEETLASTLAGAAAGVEKSDVDPWMSVARYLLQHFVVLHRRVDAEAPRAPA